MTCAAAVNVLGPNMVGSLAAAAMLLVSVPFLLLTLCALGSPSLDLSVLITPNTQLWPKTHEAWYFFVMLVLWNTCGYDSAGMVAAEVADGRRTYPRAFKGSLLLSTLLYVLPLAACAAADHDWSEWREGHFSNLGIEFGGPLLGFAMTAGSVASMLAISCALMCTTSRALYAMAQLRMLPPGLSRLHPECVLRSRPTHSARLTSRMGEVYW